MALRKWNRTAACDLKSKVRLAFAATFVTVALAACGGGGDDPVASVAGPSPTVPPGPSAAGGVAGGAGTPDASASANGGASTSNTGGSVSGNNNDSATGANDAVVASVPGTTTLSWIPPTANDDGTPLKLTGYRIYWGQQKGYYTNSVTVDNPGLTRYVVDQLEPAKWYFVATALSDRGESQFSNEIAMQIL